VDISFDPAKREVKRYEAEAQSRKNQSGQPSVDERDFRPRSQGAEGLAGNLRRRCGSGNAKAARATEIRQRPYVDIIAPAAGDVSALEGNWTRLADAKGKSIVKGDLNSHAAVVTTRSRASSPASHRRRCSQLCGNHALPRARSALQGEDRLCWTQFASQL
jgi:hypothetical protein